MYDYNLMLFTVLVTAVILTAWVLVIGLMLWGVIAPLFGLPAPQAGAWPWPG